MMLRYLIFFLFGCVLMPATLLAEPIFTEIASTGPGLLELNVYPSINNAGVVAFSGSPELGTVGVYSGNGGAFSTISEFNGLYFSTSNVSHPTINDAGVAAFRVGYAGAEAIYRGTSESLTTIADTSDGFGAFFGIPAINADGTVAFGGFHSQGQGIFTGDGGPLVTIAQNGTTFSRFDGFGGPSINDAGAVAFTADLGRGLGLGVFVSQGENVTPVALTSPELSPLGGRPDINNAGTVAFVAWTRINGQLTHGLFTGSNGEVTLHATGSFSEQPGINAAGTLAYHTGQAIFMKSSPASPALKVIATGDSLFGSTVTLLGFSTYGLNDVDQLAFGAYLADNRTVIVRADLSTGVERPQLTIERTVEGVVLRTPSVPGRLYTVEVATTLPNFTDPPLAQDVPGTGAVLEFTDPTSAAQKFYRLSVAQVP